MPPLCRLGEEAMHASTLAIHSDFAFPLPGFFGSRVLHGFGPLGFEFVVLENQKKLRALGI
jgi:hypothetical protein